ncbi:MAG: DsrE family protein [Streptococcus sp.]|nr:DsrE family protein [Streptococcus sp.]
MCKDKFESPVISGYGEVVYFKDAYLQPDKDKEYKAIFSIEDNLDPNTVNEHLLHVSLLMNILSVSGVDKDKIKVAIVVSGKGTDISLNNKLYNKLYGIDNPNLDVEKKLYENGVKIYVCGQSIAQLGLDEENLNEFSLFSLSALTDLLILEQKGYIQLP